MFNIFIKNAKKDEKRYQENIKRISNEILDSIEANQININEMSDILINLQSIYQKSLLDKIKEYE